MKLIKQTGLNIEKLYNRSRLARKKHIEEKVRAIIDDIRLNGDDAVLKYTRRFDGVKLTARQLKVDESEISSAYQNITPEFVGHLKTIINNVSTYYKKQLHKPCKVKGHDGVMLKEEIRPLDSVGIYIPADEILRRPKFQWFAVMPADEVLKTNMIVSKYLQASIVDTTNEYSKTTEVRSIVSI